MLAHSYPEGRLAASIDPGHVWVLKGDCVALAESLHPLPRLSTRPTKTPAAQACGEGRRWVTVIGGTALSKLGKLIKASPLSRLLCLSAGGETRAQSFLVPQHLGLSSPSAPSPHLALSPGLRDSSMAQLDICLMQPSYHCQALAQHRHPTGWLTIDRGLKGR